MAEKIFNIQPTIASTHSELESNKLTLDIIQNPASQQLEFRIKNVKTSNVSLQMMDLQDNLVYQTHFSTSDGSKKIDVSRFASVVYTISLSNQNNFSLQKVIIQN